jgi:hypothetical protein
MKRYRPNPSLRYMRVTLLIALACGWASAEPNWAALKSLTIGGEIKVSAAGGKSFRGQLQSVTDESLVVLAANTQQSLARAEVLKISIKGGSHRTRNALIGFGIGAGAGLGIGAAADGGKCTGFCVGPRDLGKAVFTPLGAIVGAIVGVAWPTGTWHEVYRSK